MDSLSLKFAVGFLGTAKGIPVNASLATPLTRTNRAALTGTTQQVLNVYQTTIGVTGTLQVNILGGQLNPLGESITGTQAFVRVMGVLVEHDVTSPATSGVQAFNAATLAFQGPLVGTASVKLLAGEWHGFGKNATVTGWTVGTAGRIDVVNLDTTKTATVNLFVVGIR